MTDLRHDVSETEASPRHRRGVLIAMCLSLVLVVASVSSLNMAMPQLAIDLSASSTALTWIADGYTVALAALVLPLGALGDRLGRRNVLLAGTVLFGLAALAAVFATSTGVLIACRVVMGVGAAMIMPGTLSTITAVFPVDQRGKAVATWSAFSVSGAIIGMLVAGGLLEFWGWQSTFGVTAALAAVSFVAALVLTPNTADPDHAHLDLPGAVLSAAGIGGLVFGIIEGAENGWTNPLALVGLGLAAAGLSGFVLRSLRTPTPLLDPRLFALRGFSAGSIGIVAQFLAAFGFFYVGLQFLQLILGYSPLTSAVALLPMVLAVIPASQLAPRLVERIGVKRVIVSGLVLMAAGFLALAQLDASSGYLAFIGPLLVFGVGMALAGTPATTAIVSSLPKAKQGVASAMNDTTREIGSALGIAIMGSMYATGYEDSVGDATGALPAEAAHAVSESAAAGLQVASAVPGEAGSRLAHAVQTAFMDGMSTSLVIGAIVVITAAAIITWIGPRRSATATADETADEAADKIELALVDA
jgi:EmrB/QacA subfamily drug resistance transporter